MTKPFDQMTEDEMAKEIAKLLKHSKGKFTPHPQLGLNPHPLSCKTCGLVFGVTPLFLGIKNVMFPCSCGVIEFTASTEDFISCHKCGERLTSGFELRPGEPVISRSNCTICEQNIDYDLEISRKGGARVRCLVCHSTGVLDKTHPAVKDFRKKKKVPANRSVGFTLDIDQCPRCLAYGKHRTFTEAELKELEINETNYKHASVEPPKGKAAKKAPDKKDKESTPIPKGFHVAKGSEMAH